MIRRLYKWLSYAALVQMLATLGLVGYLFASKKLSSQRLDQIAIVLRGEFPTSRPAETRPAVVEAPPQRSREELARLESQRKMYELIADRQRRDIADRSALNQSIRLEVDRRMEDIERQSRQFQEQRRQLQVEAGQDGFSQMLDVFSRVSPKQSKDLLREAVRGGMKEADVVQILVAMESDQRKKIVEACKTSEERAWITRILNQIRALDAVVPGAEQTTAGVAASAPAGAAG